MFSAKRQAVEPRGKHLESPLAVFEAEQHMFPPKSHPTLVAAAFSCVVHLCLLGLSSAFLLTQGEPPAPPLRVTLLQPAAPLPVGATEAPATPSPATPPSPPPVAKPLPPPKKPPAPVPPRVKKLPPPKVVTATPPPEPEPQPATMTLPAAGNVANNSDASDPHATLTNGTPSTAGSDTGTAAAGGHPLAGRGVEGGGTSAHPDYSVNPKPPYPMLARRRGEQGTVLLRVRVRTDGSVAEAEIKQSSGSTLLDDTALRTVRDSWRFTPARLDGVPVESWVEVPIRFVLGKA